MLRSVMAGALSIGLGSHALAQVRPDLAYTDEDEIYTGSEFVSNTGMGALQDRQVMVYDLSDGTSELGWDYAAQGKKGTLLLNEGNPAYDPDVVLAEYESDYALAVFINQNNYVQWESYYWDGNEFQLHRSCILGTQPTCGSPNVDVNAAGMVAITWHQSTEIWEGWELDFDNPAIVTTEKNRLALRGGMSFVVSDIYGAYGYVDGSGNDIEGKGCACSEEAGPSISGAINCLGDQVSPAIDRPLNSYEEDELYEFNKWPDVSISQFHDEGTRVTFSYVNGHYLVDDVTADIHTTTGTVYQPHMWYSGAYTGLITTPLKGQPRIASRKNNDYPNDIEIVTATGSCNNWKINNWGIFNDDQRLDVTLVNPEYTTRYSTSPVVTYRGGSEGYDGDYTIVWATEVEFCLDENYGSDVLGRSYKNGDIIAGGTVYSYINKGNFHGDGLEGDQLIPSVAGRLTDEGVDYMFFESLEDINMVLYKHSDVVAGSGHVRVAPDPNVNTTKGGSTGRTFDAADNFSSYPNPFTDKVNFAFTLAKGEKGDRMIITDIKGIQVKSFDLSSYKEGAHTLEWEPGEIAAGIYLVRYSTSQGIKTLEITTTD